MRQTRDVRSFVHYYRIPWIATLLLSLLLAACNNGGKGPGY